MTWTSWALVLVLGLASGTAGAFIYMHRVALLRYAAPYWLHLGRRLQPLRRNRPVKAARKPPSTRVVEDVVVLIPDGRPWPLGPAVQLLELAWRWQVVHGANLPVRARQGEGAYVWRPPLPARSPDDRHSVEAER